MNKQQQVQCKARMMYHEMIEQLEIQAAPRVDMDRIGEQVEDGIEKYIGIHFDLLDMVIDGDPGYLEDIAEKVAGIAQNNLDIVSEVVDPSDYTHKVGNIYALERRAD